MGENGKDAMRPYALKPGEGWTYRYDIDFTVKAGELHPGRGAAFIEYTTRQGWLAARQLLYQFVFEDLHPAEARRRNRAAWAGEQRTWSFTQGAKLAQVGDIAWTRTVADVRIDAAEHDCSDVRDWAAAVLADTAALIETLD